jgi:purine-cytosine permease-like protein
VAQAGRLTLLTGQRHISAFLKEVFVGTTTLPPAGTDTLSARLDRLYEFEREPVSPDKLHDGRYFAAVFAGEHVAGTEFVIGALFVQWGASARDLVLGLLIGNLLAVLSWAFICSPIAVRTRLTLYWYARRIIGPGLSVAFNLINALLYSFLGAAMIGVSASAVGLGVSKLGVPFKHPALDDMTPNSVGWVVIVLLVGMLVVYLAIAGFKRLSQFAGVCAPWMFPIFLAAAIVTLPKLGEVGSAADVWHIAKTRIWNGQPLSAKGTLEAGFQSDLDRGVIPAAFREELRNEPKPARRVWLGEEARVEVVRPGEEWRIEDGEATYLVQKHEHVLRLSLVEPSRLGFWHILFFAWFCNLATHIGLSDMALFRYARHWRYGFYSALGMFLGHYVCWICAGVMGAVIWGELNPGRMAYEAVGLAGLLCVLAAGWTTANPTIYRAGLALQIITPNWPRWKVTLAVGMMTTVVALFPAIFMKLLEFVAIYGLVLMPIGAVVFAEHWLLPRLGLRQYWAQRRGLTVNMPAAITWLVVLVLAFPIEQFTGGALRSPMEMLGVHLFFRWLPCWFVSVGVYIVLCYLTPAAREDGPLAGDRGGTRGEGRGAEESWEPGAERTDTPSATPIPQSARFRPVGPATWLAGAIALVSLVACVALPVWVFAGGSEPAVYDARLSVCKTGLLVATVIYFIAGIYYTTQREKARGAK